MADIITNTLQIGSNNLILRDADAQEQLVTVKDGLQNAIMLNQYDASALVNSGFYNSSSLQKETNNLYGYTDPIFVKKGYKVYGSAWTDNARVGVLFQGNSDGTIVRCMQKGTSRQQTAFSVIAEEDMYVVVCGRTAYGATINVINSLEATNNNVGYLADIVGGIEVGLEQGAFNSSGLNNTSTTRVRSYDYIPVVEGKKYFVVAKDTQGDFLQASISFYNTADYVTARTSYVNWTTTPVTITIPQGAMYMRILLRFASDATINTSNVSQSIVVDANSLYGQVIGDNTTQKVEYTGAKINLNNTYKYERRSISLSLPSNFRIQGGDSYGGYIVLGTDKSHAVPEINAPSLYVFDKTTGNYVGGVAISGAPDNCHCNTIAFANELHSGNDVFPYLYVNDWDGDGNIYVVDLALNQSAITATIVQTISISALSTSLVGAGYSDFAIDWDDGKLMLLRYAIADTYTDTSGNETVISVFNLPSVTGETVALTDSDIISHAKTDKVISYRQQGIYKNGKIIVASGYNTGKLYVIDPVNAEISSVVDLTPVISTSEPNAIFVVDGTLYLMVAWSPHIYILSF